MSSSRSFIQGSRHSHHRNSYNNANESNWEIRDIDDEEDVVIMEPLVREITADEKQTKTTLTSSMKNADQEVVRDVTYNNKNNNNKGDDCNKLSTGKWTDDEHRRLLSALTTDELVDLASVANSVDTRRCSQIRMYAIRHFPREWDLFMKQIKTKTKKNTCTRVHLVEKHRKMQTTNEQKISETESKPITVQFHHQSRDSNTNKWDFKWNMLQEYKNRYQTTLLPNSYCIGSLNLGRWVWKQRSQARRGLLSWAKKVKLDSLGFIWDLNSPQAEKEKSRVPAEPPTQQQQQPQIIVTPDANNVVELHVPPHSNTSLGTQDTTAKWTLENRLKMNESMLKNNSSRNNNNPCELKASNLGESFPQSPSMIQSSGKGFASSKVFENTQRGVPYDLTSAQLYAQSNFKRTRKSRRRQMASHKIRENSDLFRLPPKRRRHIDRGQDYACATWEQSDDEEESGYHYDIDADSAYHRHTIINDSENGLYKEMRPPWEQAPREPRNFWQTMYDHDHQWYVKPNDNDNDTPHQKHTMTLKDQNDDEGRDILACWDYTSIQPYHDDYTKQQTSEVLEIRRKEQAEKKAGWIELHCQDLEWKACYAELVHFSLVNGHCWVPSENDDYTLLYNWVAKQRILKRKSQLSAERECLLEQIGFAWGSNTRAEARVKKPKRSNKVLAEFCATVSTKRKPLDSVLQPLATPICQDNDGASKRRRMITPYCPNIDDSPWCRYSSENSNSSEAAVSSDVPQEEYLII